MIRHEGFWWPDDVGEKWRHALMHVASADVGLSYCRRHRTAVQAGGNIGLWPRRYAEQFARVLTFEPDAISRACLERNVPGHVVVSGEALGAAAGRCAVEHRSLGSHRVVDGDDVAMTTVDTLALDDVDLLQFDLEGYEGQALLGASQTIERCHPVIQVELRGFADRFGQSVASIREWLRAHGYRQVATAQGSDFIFRHEGAPC